MVSRTFSTSLEQPKLAILVRRTAPLAPTDDIYIENPHGAFRGLFFALILNLILVSVGLAGWEIWRLLH